MEIEASEGTFFEVVFLRFLKEVGHTGRGYINLFSGTNLEVPIFSKSIQLYELWHEIQGRLWWDRFCLVSSFSLGWKCVIVADMYFLEVE
jgi:hypothetical protein